MVVYGVYFSSGHCSVKSPVASFAMFLLLINLVYSSGRAACIKMLLRLNDKMDLLKMLDLLNLIWNFGSSVRTRTCFTDLNVSLCLCRNKVEQNYIDQIYLYDIIYIV